MNNDESRRNHSGSQNQPGRQNPDDQKNKARPRDTDSSDASESKE